MPAKMETQPREQHGQPERSSDVVVSSRLKGKNELCLACVAKDKYGCPQLAATRQPAKILAPHIGEFGFDQHCVQRSDCNLRQRFLAAAGSKQHRIAEQSQLLCEPLASCGVTIDKKDRVAHWFALAASDFGYPRAPAKRDVRRLCGPLRAIGNAVDVSFRCSRVIVPRRVWRPALLVAGGYPSMFLISDENVGKL